MRHARWATAGCVTLGLALTFAAAGSSSDVVTAGRLVPVHALDSTLTDSTFAGWVDRVIGAGARVRWEANDCGEATGSPSDSVRDLPWCAEMNAVLSGGRDLTIQLLMGTVGQGLNRSPELYLAAVSGPESSAVFHRLSEVERYLDQEAPFLGNDSIYVDVKGNVHVVTSARKDVRLTREGPFRDPKLSSDRQLIGFLPASVVESGPRGQDPVEVSTEVWIYQGGRVARRFGPDGFIRDWGFVGAGDSIAVSSGGLHFAGFYVLYDLASGEELARSEDPMTEQSPAWVRSLEP
ncbi:MAG TPA: hypothetical protein VFP58_07975 [Candidatus Eisenbacteria bacterium]|nr:hypothetical protein [Candidatus Eisenbacteria bacterium]